MILVVKPYLEWGSVTSMGKNQIFQSELPNNSLQNCKLLCRMLWFWFYSWFLYFRNMDTENQERKCWFLLTKQDDPTMWNQVRNSSKPSVWLLWRWLLTVCLDADALIKTLFPGLVLTPKMKISPGYEMRWRPTWDFMLLLADILSWSFSSLKLQCKFEPLLFCS